MKLSEPALKYHVLFTEDLERFEREQDETNAEGFDTIIEQVFTELKKRKIPFQDINTVALWPADKKSSYTLDYDKLKSGFIAVLTMNLKEGKTIHQSVEIHFD